MDAIRTALQVYRDSLKDTAKAYRTGIVGVAALILGGALLYISWKVLGPIAAMGGLAGGILVGLLLAIVSAMWVGAYLSLVESALDSARPLGASDIRDAIGHYYIEVISVMFWVWIATLLLGFVIPGAIFGILYLVASVLLNPVPEMIYNNRVRAPEIFERSTRWIIRQWPEWFAPQLLLTALFWIFLPGMGGVFSMGFDFSFLEQIVNMVERTMAAARMGGAGLWTALAKALVVPFLVHGVMLFRGALFRRLDQGSRRARAWKAQF